MSRRGANLWEPSVVDPVSVTLLTGAITAMATGAGGEAGKQGWTSLTALVHKAFGRRSSPETMLTALEAAPKDQGQATALATVLTDHAEKDRTFAIELRAWLSEARRILHLDDDQITNIVGGGAQIRGPVFQGRDFTGPISFGTPPRPSSHPDPAPD
jgi:hypothetical protein